MSRQSMPQPSAPWRALAQSLFLGFAAVALGQTGVQVNVGPTGRDMPGDAANEVSMIASPRDPNIMAAGWRNFTDRDYSNREAGCAYSTDAGRTWHSTGIITHFPDRFAPYMASDPALAAAPDGTMYYAHLVWDQFGLDRGIVLSSSVDGGRSWTMRSVVIADANWLTPDKQWIAVDCTGGPTNGTLYVSYTMGLVHPFYIYIQRSTDGGRTFDRPVRVSAYQGEHTSLPIVAPDGTVHLVSLFAVRGGGTLRVRRSLNAQDQRWPLRFSQATSLRAAAVSGGWGQIPVGLHVPAIATDSSGGAYHGAVYIAYVRAGWAGVTNIAVARSHDGGNSWQVAARVNDRGFMKRRDCFMPAISVAPDGRIDLTWYDRRNDPDNLRAELYYSYSIDGGKTWQPNVRLSDSFDPTAGYPRMSPKIGEYHASFSTVDELRIAYTGTYNGQQNIYCIIHRPYLGDLNGDRLLDGEDIDALAMALCNPTAHANAHVGVDLLRRGDFNGDNQVDLDDVVPFLGRMSQRRERE